MIGLARLSVSKFCDEGIVALLNSAKRHLLNGIIDMWLKQKYRLKYGDLAPQPDEIMWIDPQEIEYTIEHRHLREEKESLPNYGVIGGCWDLHKNYWRDSPVWGGLVERFEEGKRWENTSYYQFTLDRLESNEDAGYLDGPQTRENLDRYTSHLDDLYRDMKNCGYDSSSVITVHIGRNGEWISGHGNHRRTLASILGIESIPVRIRFRHEKWQNIRRRIYYADSLDEISDIEEFLHHPDIRDMDVEYH